MKKCSTCGVNKGLSQFPFQNKAKGVVMSSCKKCRSEKRKKHRANNPDLQKKADKEAYIRQRESRIAYARKYRKLHPQRTRNTNLKAKYGITAIDYEKMLARQKGCCAICGKHQGSLNKILCVDHCHNSGKVRGLLCDTCNKFLGFYEKLSEQCERYLKLPPVL